MAGRYRLLLRQLYGDNYGESMDDVAPTLAAVRQQLDADWPTDQLKTVTEDAITLRDPFGYEVTDSIRAAKALVDNFGVDGDEAFRLIAEGARNGLDYSGELLDTVSEYSVQFKKLGLSANDMFKVMQSGARTTALGTWTRSATHTKSCLSASWMARTRLPGICRHRLERRADGAEVRARRRERKGCLADKPRRRSRRWMTRCSRTLQA